MTTFRKHLFTAFAALSLGTAAFAVQAQDSAPQGTAAPTQQGDHPKADHAGHRRMPSPEQMAAFRAKRIARLHDELKITPAQESAFNSFVASMQPPARTPQDRTQAHAEWASLSAPQRMEKTIAMQKQRTAMLEQRQGALNSFYSVLSPEQKKTFDARASHMHGHFGGHGGMHGDAQHGATARS